MKVYTDKKISQLLFLHNISRWHYSVIIPFAKYWQNKPRALSQTEKTALVIWQTLESDNAQKSNVFLIEKYISGKILQKEKTQMDSCLDAFRKRFEYHYDRQAANLIKLEKCLRSMPLDPLIKKTAAIYNCEIIAPKTFITLSHNANREAGGMILADRVILQFGDYNWSNNNEPILNLWLHELTHSANIYHLLPEDLAIKLPTEFTGSKADYIDEIIHQALWGQLGILAQEYFGLSDNEIATRKAKLIKQRAEPFKTMSRHSYAVGRYIKQRLEINPNFHFSKPDLVEILNLISS
jgi:hypothetical protein